MFAENNMMLRSMNLTTVFKRIQKRGYTAEFRELPEFLFEGGDQEEALRNLIDGFANYLTWKSVQDLRAGYLRTTPTNSLELQIL